VMLTGNGDVFLYNNLVDNENLVDNHSFAYGSVIGTLKHGTFVSTCGSELQSEQRWHLHWGFFLNSTGFFQAEGCILKYEAAVSEDYNADEQEIWTCGTDSVAPGELLKHYGNITDTGGGVGYHGADEGTSNDESFWTNLIAGIQGLFDLLIGNTLPDHNSAISFITPILNGVKIVARITWVLMRGNFNFVPAFTVLFAVFAMRGTIALINGIVSIVRIIKSIPMVP